MAGRRAGERGGGARTDHVAGEAGSAPSRGILTTLGLLASWAAALFGAWALVGGLVAVTPTHPARRSAERALAASAMAALVASAALVSLLLSGDMTVSYVARSISTNLAAPYRVAALWNLPAGGVLPTAALVAIIGLLMSGRARSSLGIASLGAVVMALCASSLAASPFATLPWIPTEGLGLSPQLQHPLSVLGAVALSFAVAVTASAVALMADGLADSREGRRQAVDAVLVASLVFLGVAMWGAARGSFATGTSSSSAPPVAWGGMLLPSLVALLFTWQTRRVGGTPALAASLGSLGLMSVVLLGVGTAQGRGLAITAFTILSLGGVAAGAAVAAIRERATLVRALHVIAILLLSGGGAATLWLAGGRLLWMRSGAQWLLLGGGMALVAAASAGDAVDRSVRPWSVASLALVGLAAGLWLAPITSPTTGWCVLAGASLGLGVSRLLATPSFPERIPRALLALAVTFAALGAAGEGWGLTSTLSLASGARTSVATRFGTAISLAHQGISRFEDSNAHVEALAIEPSRDGRALALLSVERRDYVDSRDEPLGSTTVRPAVLSGLLEDLRVRMDSVAPDETAHLQLSVIPFAGAWGAALAMLVLALVIQLVSGISRPSLPASVEPISP